MPKVEEVKQDFLKAYTSHGVILELKGREDQAIGDCPFCGGVGKFAVAVETGLAHCWTCTLNPNSPKGGVNPLSFLRLLWEMSDKATKDYAPLAKDRGIVNSETLEYWGAAKSITNGNWLIPGYDSKGKIAQIYRRIRVKDKGGNWGWKLFPTPGLDADKDRHGIHGISLYNKKKSIVYLCEGFWDGAILWEVLRCAKQGEDQKLTLTANEERSLLKNINVLAAPGAQVFSESWRSLFADKEVYLLFDNDHPKENPLGSGRSSQSGYDGMQRVAGMLASSPEPPASIRYLNWGQGTSSFYDPNLPSGYDLRDLLRSAGSMIASRLPTLEKLLAKLEPVPEDWILGRSSSSVREGKVEIECTPCTDWQTLVLAWRKALTWIDGLDRALAVMLAVVTSTESVGDQLWFKILGPPSSAKTVLCEALSVARKYVYPKDTLTGLTSGYQLDREGSANLSMVDKLRNKTLVINDGDTILQLPNRAQILSQMRAFYSRNLRSQYGNSMSTDHEGINTTILLCGTESLRNLDSSELGERLLDCVIADKLDEETEDDIALRKAYQAERDLSCKSDGTLESRDSAEMVLAKQLTGGYVTYLRENAQDLLSGVDAPDEMIHRCVTLGTFVAYIRSRPSKKQDEHTQRELSFRLVSQHVRLAKCLAVVLNKKTIDAEVMRRVTQVTLDTARGRTLEICRHFYKVGSAGMEFDTLILHTEQDPATERLYLKHLIRIGAVAKFRPEIARVKAKMRYKLSERLNRLYQEVHNL